MSRLTWMTLGWALGLAGSASAHALSPSSPPVPEWRTPAVLAADEPAALRRLIQRASDLETSARAEDHAWQAAVLYCEASRLGSIEGQYRLGMLYAFGSGVPESRALAAALFSLASSQGHAQAGKMLESIQMTSAELPPCVTGHQLPEKAPRQSAQGLSAAWLEGSTPSIDRYLRALPAHKRWVIPLATTLSAWYALDPKLVLSVIAVESNFETGAQSPKAAMGLMQLIPGTAQRFNVRDAYNATQNMRGGMAYLRWLLAYYRGNTVYALAAYNAGEGRVDRYKGVPPFPETRNYVRRVMGLYGQPSHGFDERITAPSMWLRAKAR